METLFEVPIVKIISTKYRCKHCKHIFKHQYGNTRYCNIRQQKNTAYGNLKVKSLDNQCSLFELKNDTTL